MKAGNFSRRKKLDRGTVITLAIVALIYAAVFVLERLFGLTGVQLAQPVADLLSFAIAIPLALGVLKDLKDKEAALKQ